MALKRTLTWPRLRGRRRGQALVEFAIVAPVMVTILLFSMYFYEIIQIKLKTQEVARFAAWEYTSFPLHEYGDRPSGKFNEAKSEIEQDIAQRYANLKGGDRGRQSKWFMVGWEPPSVRARDQNEPAIPGGGLANQVFSVGTRILDLISMKAFTHGNYLLMLMMGIHKIENNIIFGARASRFNPPRQWGFNTRGYPRVSVRVRYDNLLIPRSFMEGASTGWFREEGRAVRHFQARKRHFNETVAVVADSWRLHHGEDIKGSSSKSKPYWKQVDKMAFVSPKIRGVVRDYTTALQFFLSAIVLAAFQPPLGVKPADSTLVSIAYREGDPASGKITLQEDYGKVSYDTSPMPPGSEYEATLEQRGGNFMGCKEAEQLGCFDSLSQDNPFGDYVLPPEQP